MFGGDRSCRDVVQKESVVGGRLSRRKLFVVLIKAGRVRSGLKFGCRQPKSFVTARDSRQQYRMRPPL